MLGHEFREAVCLGPSWGPPAIIFEPLEPRLLLSGEGGSAAAVADPATGPAARGTSTSPLADLVEGNNEFAFAMYQALREAAGSLFFSPLSISAALSMTFAGAAGNTARQMAETLRFTLPPELHHAVFGSLIDGLQTGAADESADGSSEDAFTLNIANSLWGQYNFPFRDEFVEGLAHHYDGPMYPMDFRADADACRQTINEWVSQHTNERRAPSRT